MRAQLSPVIYPISEGGDMFEITVHLGRLKICPPPLDSSAPDLSAIEVLHDQFPTSRAPSMPSSQVPAWRWAPRSTTGRSPVSRTNSVASNHLVEGLVSLRIPYGKRVAQPWSLPYVARDLSFPFGKIGRFRVCAVGSY